MGKLEIYFSETSGLSISHRHCPLASGGTRNIKIIEFLLGKGLFEN